MSAADDHGKHNAILSALQPIVLHKNIRIGVSAEELWPYLFRTREWKSPDNTETRVSGDDEALDRVTAITSQFGRTRYIRTTSKVDHQKLSFQVNTEGGKAVGFTVFTLIIEGGDTRLQYDVFLDSDVLLEGHLASEVSLVERDAYCKEVSDRLDAELQSLKALAETGTNDV